MGLVAGQRNSSAIDENGPVSRGERPGDRSSCRRGLAFAAAAKVLGALLRGIEGQDRFTVGLGVVVGLGEDFGPVAAAVAGEARTIQVPFFGSRRLRRSPRVPARAPMAAFEAGVAKLGHGECPERSRRQERTHVRPSPSIYADFQAWDAKRRQGRAWTPYVPSFGS
jgi:hypothetical protein